MNTIPVNLAVEDRLSEAVLRRILTFTNRGYAAGTAYGRGGYGYLKKTAHGWNRAASGISFVLLTDLDRYECPQALINDWLIAPRSPSLLFRVAVREVEAWLLADPENLSDFLRVPRTLFPVSADDLADPKATLVAVARRSRSRDIRDRVVPKRGSTASVGPDYNGCMVEFVNAKWNVPAAASGSPSLARTVRRLLNFSPAWPTAAP